MTEMKEKHYGAIDGLRAYSAIGIILMHVRANGHYNINGFVFDRVIPSCNNLVFLFMVISGFAMCCGYYDRIVKNEITIQQFYSKRYARIWPFFACLCVLDLLISPAKESVYEVFANLTLCFGLLPNANISVIGVGWFLGVVFVFYLVFPFFCYLLSNKRRAWFSFIISVVFNQLCQIYFFNTDHVPADFSSRSNIVYCSMFFFAGGLIYLYRELLGRIAEKYRYVVLLSGIIAVVGYYVTNGDDIVMLVMYAIFLIYTIGIAGKGIMQNRITGFLSSISMEIYLCHMVIYRLIEKLNVTHMFLSESLSYITTVVLTIIGGIVFSVAVKKGLEIKWQKKN